MIMHAPWRTNIFNIFIYLLFKNELKLLHFSSTWCIYYEDYIVFFFIYIWHDMKWLIFWNNGEWGVTCDEWWGASDDTIHYIFSRICCIKMHIYQSLEPIKCGVVYVQMQINYYHFHASIIFRVIWINLFVCTSILQLCVECDI